jgi:ubiquitin-conjugating enzyme E2 Q
MLHLVVCASVKDPLSMGFELEPMIEDRIDSWRVKLMGFAEDTTLYKDMQEFGVVHIELEMSFPEDYPFLPPYVRVVRPRFAKGTGFIIDGAICMELLSTAGWNPCYDPESVIVSVRAMLAEGGARLEIVELREKAARKQQQQQARIAAATAAGATVGGDTSIKVNGEGDVTLPPPPPLMEVDLGSYTVAEAARGFQALTAVHEKKGWSSRPLKS